MIQTATETIGNGDKGSVLVKCTDIYLLVSLTCFVFFGFNTARKAAWLKLTQLECARDRTSADTGVVRKHETEMKQTINVS